MTGPYIALILQCENTEGPKTRSAPLVFGPGHPVPVPLLSRPAWVRVPTRRRSRLLHDGAPSCRHRSALRPVARPAQDLDVLRGRSAPHAERDDVVELKLDVRPAQPAPPLVPGPDKLLDVLWDSTSNGTGRSVAHGNRALGPTDRRLPALLPRHEERVYGVGAEVLVVPVPPAAEPPVASFTELRERYGKGLRPVKHPRKLRLMGLLANSVGLLSDHDNHLTAARDKPKKASLVIYRDILSALKQPTYLLKLVI